MKNVDYNIPCVGHNLMSISAKDAASRYPIVCAYGIYYFLKNLRISQCFIHIMACFYFSAKVAKSFHFQTHIFHNICKSPTSTKLHGSFYEIVWHGVCDVNLR